MKEIELPLTHLDIDNIIEKITKEGSDILQDIELLLCDLKGWTEEELSKNRLEFYSSFEKSLPKEEKLLALSESENDIDAIKLFYEAMRDLSDSQASDRRLWACLCLLVYPNYTRERFGMMDYLRRWFAEKNRYKTRNTLARLWWIGRLTYDDSLENPFGLTEYVMSTQDFMQNILERNYSHNPNVLRSVLRAFKKAEDEKGFLVSENSNRDKIRYILKYVNSLGAPFVLDCIPEDVLTEKVYKEIVKQITKKIA